MVAQLSQNTNNISIIKLMKLPDFISLFNIICGVLSIFFSIKNSFNLALIFLILAAVFDYLDGKVARLTKTSNDFGKQMDSLSDIVSFGVAPVIFAFSLGFTSIFNLIILIFFLACGVLRLARYNIMPSLNYFQGMPITTNAFIMPIFYYLTKSPNINYLFIYIYLISGILMIMKFRFKKV